VILVTLRATLSAFQALRARMERAA